MPRKFAIRSIGATSSGNTNSTTMLSSSSLFFAPDKLQCKVAYFYREADQCFKPVRLVLNYKSYPNLNVLLAVLNQRIPLRSGVRAIFTPRGRHLISDIDEIVNDGKYVVSSSNIRSQGINTENMKFDAIPWHNIPPKLVYSDTDSRFVRTGLPDYDPSDGEDLLNPGVRGRMTRLQELRNFDVRRNQEYVRNLDFRTQRMPSWADRIRRIVFVRNGHPDTLKQYTLAASTAYSMSKVRADLSEIFNESVEKIFTIDGRPLRSVEDMFECADLVFVVSYGENFKPNPGYARAQPGNNAIKLPPISRHQIPSPTAMSRSRTKVLSPSSQHRSHYESVFDRPVVSPTSQHRSSSVQEEHSRAMQQPFIRQRSGSSSIIESSSNEERHDRPRKAARASEFRHSQLATPVDPMLMELTEKNKRQHNNNNNNNNKRNKKKIARSEIVEARRLGSFVDDQQNDPAFSMIQSWPNLVQDDVSMLPPRGNNNKHHSIKNDARTAWPIGDLRYDDELPKATGRSEKSEMTTSKTTGRSEKGSNSKMTNKRTKMNGNSERMIRERRELQHAEEELVWLVRLVTGTLPNGSSTSHVMMTAYGHRGPSEPVVFVARKRYFVTNSSETFKTRLADIGDIYKIRLEISNTGPHPDWFCEEVLMENEETGEQLAFKCKKWLSERMGDRLIVREMPAYSETRPPVAVCQYDVIIRTGDFWNGGSSGVVSIVIFGERGDTGPRALKQTTTPNQTPFVKGQVDTFLIESVSLGEIRRIRLTHQPAANAMGWFAESVMIRDLNNSLDYLFPVNRWLNSHEDDRQLTTEVRAHDALSHMKIQDKQLWPFVKWMFTMPDTDLVFYSTASHRPLRITSGGFIDARAEAVDRTGIFRCYHPEGTKENVFDFFTTTTRSPPSHLAFGPQKIVSKANYTPNSDVRVHIFPSRELVFESDRYASNYLSVTANGQLYPETHSIAAPGPNQCFFCYVKGCFRNSNIVMLCTSLRQTICIDRDPSMLTATGKRNRMAHFRVHKVTNGVRMFESLIFPGSYLQMKKGQCDCLGNGDHFSEFKVRRCREQGYVTLECARERGFFGFTATGFVQVFFDTLSTSPNCRIYPEIVEYGRGHKKAQPVGDKTSVAEPTKKPAVIPVEQTKQQLAVAQLRPPHDSFSDEKHTGTDPDDDLSSDVDDLYRSRHRAKRPNNLHVKTNNNAAPVKKRKSVGVGTASGGEEQTSPSKQHQNKKGNKSIVDDDESEKDKVEPSGKRSMQASPISITPPSPPPRTPKESPREEKPPKLVSSPTPHKKDELLLPPSSPRPTIEDDPEEVPEEPTKKTAVHPPKKAAEASPKKTPGKKPESTKKKAEPPAKKPEPLKKTTNPPPKAVVEADKTKSGAPAKKTEGEKKKAEPLHEERDKQTPEALVEEEPAPARNDEGVKHIPEPKAEIPHTPEPKAPEKEKTPEPPVVLKDEPKKPLAPTIVPFANFTVKKDCESLQKALTRNSRSHNTAEVLIDILTARSTEQRGDIKVAYQKATGKDLLLAIGSLISGNLFNVMAALLAGALKSQTDFAVYQLNKALKASKQKDFDAVIDIICTAPFDELRKIKEAYQKTYEHPLVNDVQSGQQSTSDKQKDEEANYPSSFIAAMLQRPASAPVIYDKDVKSVSKHLHDTIRKSANKDRSPRSNSTSLFQTEMMSLLTTNGHRFLRHVFEFFKQESKNNSDITEFIKSETTGPVQKILLSAVEAIRNKDDYIARRFHDVTVKNTDDVALIRFVIGRSEIDLEDVKKAYERLYHGSLESTIEKETSGDYMAALVSIVQGNVSGKKEKAEKPPPERHDPEIIPVDSRVDAPTMVDAQDFDAKQDCDQLKQAFSAKKLDETDLIAILAHRSSQQRGEIVTTYKEIYKKELQSEMEKALKKQDKQFTAMMLDLLKTPADLAASYLKRAFDNKPSNDENALACLVQIICTSTAAELQTIKDAYQKLTKKELRQELNNAKVMGKVGFIGRVLASFLNRPPSASPPHVDFNQAKEDAEKINQDVVAEKKKNSEEVFAYLFSSRGKGHIRAVFEMYRHLYQTDIEEVIQTNYEGSTERGLTLVVDAIRSEAKFSAHLFSSTKTTVDLWRIVILRCELDLGVVNCVFKKSNQKSLIQEVEDKVVTHQSTQDVIVRLIRGNNTALADQLDQLDLNSNRRSSVTSLPIVSLQRDSVNTPTVKPVAKFDVDADCRSLRKAILKEDTDEAGVAIVLAKRSWQQRAEIETKYRESFDENLEQSLQGTEERFCRLMLYLLKLPLELAAAELKRSFDEDDGETNDKANLYDNLVEIICSEPPENLEPLKEQYRKLYEGAEIEDQVNEKVTGTFLRNFFVASLNRQPYVELEEDILENARTDAKQLRKLENAMTAEEDMQAFFIELFTQRSPVHLRAVFDYYVNDYSDTQGGVEAIIPENFRYDEDAQRVLLSFIRMTRNKAAYYAKLLEATLSTYNNHALLSRVIVSRCELDLANVKIEYQRLFGRALTKDIETNITADDETDYRLAITALITGNYF